MMRLFRDGRTETIRSLSLESVEFVRAMDNPKVSVEERRRLHKVAVEGHNNYAKMASIGDGVDRHLFALYVVAMGTETEAKFLREALQVCCFRLRIYCFCLISVLRSPGSCPPARFPIACTMAGLRMTTVETTLFTGAASSFLLDSFLTLYLKVCRRRLWSCGRRRLWRVLLLHGREQNQLPHLLQKIVFGNGLRKIRGMP